MSKLYKVLDIDKGLYYLVDATNIDEAAKILKRECLDCMNMRSHSAQVYDPETDGKKRYEKVKADFGSGCKTVYEKRLQEALTELKTDTFINKPIKYYQLTI